MYVELYRVFIYCKFLCVIFCRLCAPLYTSPLCIYIHVMSLPVKRSICLWRQQQMDVIVATIIHHHHTDSSTDTNTYTVLACTGLALFINTIDKPPV